MKRQVAWPLPGGSFPAQTHIRPSCPKHRNPHEKPTYSTTQSFNGGFGWKGTLTCAKIVTMLALRPAKVNFGQNTFGQRNETENTNQHGKPDQAVCSTRGLAAAFNLCPHGSLPNRQPEVGSGYPVLPPAVLLLPACGLPRGRPWVRVPDWLWPHFSTRLHKCNCFLGSRCSSLGRSPHQTTETAGRDESPRMGEAEVESHERGDLRTRECTLPKWARPFG